MSLIVALFGLVALAGAFPGSSAVRSSGTAFWRHAIEVPGTAALNVGGSAWVRSISCGAVGECAGGGSYQDGAGNTQAFVVSEKKGRWGKAVQVPGMAALNAGGSARLRALSCGAARDCAAGGSYRDSSGRYQAFVLTERNGVWRPAVEVPRTATLNAGGNAAVYSVSCSRVGTCAAGGYYKDASGHYQAFVVGEKNGIWRRAIEVPGTATLNAGGNASVYSVSCRAVGECAVGGYYTDASGHSQAFVVSSKKGIWAAAVEVPGTAALNAGGYAAVDAVSCGAVGDCSASGHYFEVSGAYQVFVVTEKKGVWGTAVQVPGTAALNLGGNARLRSLSCPAVGECSAGGYYVDGSGHYQVFEVNEKKGVWGAAVEVPGTAALNVGGSARLRSLSCGAARDCVAAGLYTDGPGNTQGFVVREKKGIWGKAIKVPGTTALNVRGNARVYAVSCSRVNECAAGGSYRDRSGSQAFVADTN
jgi:hypothetical protein